jgi:FkbM family methyltransferase
MNFPMTTSLQNKDRSLLGSLARAARRSFQKAILAANLIQRVGLIEAWSLARASKSQINQDLFALSELGAIRGGFFVEFGATNGVDRSNTRLLEKRLGWKGILAEPARCWHLDLARNRSSLVEHRCVWKETGEKLTFSEVAEPELSTLASFSDDDFHGQSRKSYTKYEVETVSLGELLRTHRAPEIIDFFSIDTEGSELEILAAFDFTKHRFKVIVCEHNYAPIREHIYGLLTSKGYVRKYPDLSRFDDWYVWQH